MSSSRLSAIQSSINTFLLDPSHHDLLALIKGLRNGIVYGAKIRFPHALVMVFLFRSGTLRQKALTILQLTHTHARNLGIFVLTYKSILLALRHLHGGKEEGLDSFLAGLVGGYLVFGRGRQSSVNQQIVMYVFARVVFGLAKLSVKSGAIRDEGGRVRKVAYPVYVSISWACIMWLFRWHPDTVQTSLRNSMVYLYANADKWDGFGNWLWHNS